MESFAGGFPVYKRLLSCAPADHHAVFLQSVVNEPCFYCTYAVIF